MANNYYDATGVLVLNKVTPVIATLFGGFNVQEYPGDGEAYIAQGSGRTGPLWDEMLPGLRELTANLGLSLQKDAQDTTKEYLYRLASHFGADNDEVIANLIEHGDFDYEADLGTLFEIAKRLDDGHGLKVLKYEGCWYCDKPRLFEFGGEGRYFGRHCSIDTASTWALTFGKDLDDALEAADLDTCTNLITRELEGLLRGVLSAERRAILQVKVGRSLLVDEVERVKLLKWYAVTGCIPGDDEDSCLIFQASSRQEALAAFEEAMWKDEPQEKRDRVRSEHGQRIFVTSIVASDSPITCLA